MDWRNKLDSQLKEHFEELLKKVHLEKEAYISADNISHAQMWCALVVLMKEISHLELQVKALEKKLKGKSNISLKKELEKL